MAQSYENFDLLQRIKLDSTDVVLTKWRSRKTGLSIVHLDYDGRLAVYFDIATCPNPFAPSTYRQGLLCGGHRE